MTIESFDQLDLCPPLRRALADLNYQRPTPVQAEAIPPLLAGRDLLGCSQTGTGKTAAFALPILQRLTSGKRRVARRNARVLVLTPTRELAIQIQNSFRDYGQFLPLRLAVVVGGLSQVPQVRACSRGVDVLVATPGRLLDLIAQGHIELGSLEVFVLDEADRMLDMGFLPDIKRLLGMVPRERQTLFFSATMPPAIADLADRMLRDPVKVAVTPAATPVERIEQRVLFVDQSGKRALLGKLLQDARTDRVLVFTRTKHGADRVVQQLRQSEVQAEAIHGNKSQNARQTALANFKNGRTRVLVATDIASRGIDVEGITHVINYDLPNEPECYVHRIGRTARAGNNGVAISFCSAQDRAHLRNIERLIRKSVPAEGGGKTPREAERQTARKGAPPSRRSSRRPRRPGKRRAVAAG